MRNELMLAMVISQRSEHLRSRFMTFEKFLTYDHLLNHHFEITTWKGAVIKCFAPVVWLWSGCRQPGHTIVTKHLTIMWLPLALFSAGFLKVGGEAGWESGTLPGKGGQFSPGRQGFFGSERAVGLSHHLKIWTLVSAEDLPSVHGRERLSCEGNGGHWRSDLYSRPKPFCLVHRDGTFVAGCRNSSALWEPSLSLWLSAYEFPSMHQGPTCPSFVR